MILKKVTLATPQENILYDEVLLHLAERGRADDILRFWESPEWFVVLGRIGDEKEDLKTEAARADLIPVVRRCSGGGTVLQGPGCMNYSVVISKESDGRLADLRGSYEIILGKVIAALKGLGVNARFCPISDIALAADQRKISGNAQKRARKYILHHGTILYDFDLAKIERYLAMPKDVPEYRRGRPHLDFVANVPLAPRAIQKALEKSFDVDREEALTKEEGDSLKEFIKIKNVDLA
jgi:lipoate-protein ligase A